MNLIKGSFAAIALLSLATLSHAQLQGFFNTGQNTQVFQNGKITQKQDQSWTVVNTDKLFGFTHLGWVSAPFTDAAHGVTFVTPPANVHWISGYVPPGGWNTPTATGAQQAIYTYTTKFAVGKDGAKAFGGQYASFEAVTSLTLNGLNPAAGGSNTFSTNPLGQAKNSFNSWTAFSFGNLAPGGYTLVATVDDTGNTGMLQQGPDGKPMTVNPSAFVLQAGAGAGAPEPASLIALPIGLLLLRRRRKN